MTSPPKPWRRPRRLRGIGDLVAVVAHPIAAGIDAALGTNLKNCQSCNDRREDWNQKFPFKER